MSNFVDCSGECGRDGASCRLLHDLMIKRLNAQILERGGRLKEHAFATEELSRLGDKRALMERMHIVNTDEVGCKRRGEVIQRQADFQAYMQTILDLLYPIDLKVYSETFKYE